MSGILGYATYLPYYRLKRAAIAATLGGPPGKGTRARRLLRRGLHLHGGGRRPAPASPASPATWPPSTSPPPPRPTSTRPTPPPSTPPSASPPAWAPTTWAGRCARRSALLGAALAATRPVAGGGRRHPHRPARGARTSATAATAPPPSWWARASDGSPGPRRAHRPPGRPPASSWSAGGCPARPSPAAGRSASACTPSCPTSGGRWPPPWPGPGWPPTPSTTSSSPAPTPGPSPPSPA